MLLAFGCWLGYQLIRQNGRILLRLEALEAQLGRLGQASAPTLGPAVPSGLPIGSIAPPFELADLAGTRRALSQFRGQRLLLIFFNPGCGFCRQMADGLAALSAAGEDGRPMPVVVTTGDAVENREFFQEHGINCPVLLQDRIEWRLVPSIMLMAHRWATW